VGAFLATGFVVFLGVVLVCACSEIVLHTSIAAKVALSCFVMNPRKGLERHKDNRKTSRAVKPSQFSPFCSFSYRPKQL
jgi:hypothetical protein